MISPSFNAGSSSFLVVVLLFTNFLISVSSAVTQKKINILIQNFNFLQLINYAADSQASQHILIRIQSEYRNIFKG